MKKVATTVKIVSPIYDEFKVLGIRGRLTLQTLVEKCVYRYVTEETFRSEINNMILPAFADSGSVTPAA
jgi:hypothetical protein